MKVSDVKASGANANRDTAAWADIIIVAVPFVAIGDVAKVDATNALEQHH